MHKFVGFDALHKTLTGRHFSISTVSITVIFDLMRLIILPYFPAAAVEAAVGTSGIECMSLWGLCFTK